MAIGGGRHVRSNARRLALQYMQSTYDVREAIRAKATNRLPHSVPVLILDRMDSNGENRNMQKKSSKKLTDQLRKAIDDSGLTRYRIAQETGISEATLSKFYLGQRGLSMQALNALGDALQLTIHLGRKPTSKGN